MCCVTNADLGCSMVADVRLILGPVLGLVTTTTANVLVEIDCASPEVSLYVFKMDQLTQEGSFQHMQVRCRHGVWYH